MVDAVSIMAVHFRDAWRRDSAIASQDARHVYLVTLAQLRTTRNWKRQRAVACKRTREVARSYPWHPQGHEAKRLTGAARDARRAFIEKTLSAWQGEYYADAVEALALVFDMSKKTVRKIGPAVRRYACSRYGCHESGTHRGAYGFRYCIEHLTENPE